MRKNDGEFLIQIYRIVDLFIRTNKYQQTKRNRHRENECLMEFSIQLQ